MDAPKATKMDGYEEEVVGKAVLQNRVLIRRAVDVGVNAKVGDIFLQPARDIFGQRELKER